jgi:hypothetical protein
MKSLRSTKWQLKEKFKRCQTHYQISAGVRRRVLNAGSPSAASIPDFKTIKNQPNNSGF